MKKLVPLFLLVTLAAGCIQLASPGKIASPIVNSFDASPSRISAGESSTLSWNVGGATAVSIDQGLGSVALTGTRTVVPSATTTYTLTATNAAGIATATAQVVLLSPAAPSPTPPTPEPAPPAPAVLPMVSYFTANPSVIPAGSLSTLNWSVSNATSVLIDHGIGPVGSVGATTVSPAATTTYILTATNAAGWNGATVTVVVTAAPPPAPPPPAPAAPVEHTVTLFSAAAEDGHVEQGDGTNPYPNVGDNSANKALQAFLSFNISGIPAGATIKSASLDLNTGDVLGNPFAGLGWMRVYNHQYSAVGVEDFTPGFPTGAIYTFSAKPVAAITSTGLVSALQSKVSAGATRFQLRLQFKEYTDGDAQADALRLGEGKPKLVITYED